MIEVNELYHNCRWCKWFDKDESACKNSDAFEVNDYSPDFYKFVEEGVLDEAIKEGFKEPDFTFLKDALHESKISKKRIDEIMKVFQDEFEDNIQDWTESISNTVHSALSNHDFGCSRIGVEIVNSSKFYCRYFW